MPELLSPKKLQWADQFKVKKLKGAPLNPNAAVEARYYSRMRALIILMMKDTEKEISSFYEADHAEVYFAQDASVASQARILMNQLTMKYEDVFRDASKPIAEDFTAQSDSSAAVALKGSLKDLSGGLTLKTDFLTGEMNEIFTATVAENVGLIKSIPQEYLDAVRGAVMRSITTGRGRADLVPFLQRYRGVTLRKARFIAKDQTKKVFTNLNAARMQKIGLDKYEWLHSNASQHPRKEHIAMNGKIYSLSKPPVINSKTKRRGKPGDEPGCNCRMIPVIRFDKD